MNVFVTGASRGIGRAIVLKMVKQGAGCAFTYMSNKEAALETIKMAKDINSEVVVKSYQMDTKIPDQVEKTVDDAINDFENIDAVINNAAIVCEFKF